MRCSIVLEFDDGDATAVKRLELMRLHEQSSSRYDRTPAFNQFRQRELHRNAISTAA
jgi:hypothetical protein